MIILFWSLQHFLAVLQYEPHLVKRYVDFAAGLFIAVIFSVRPKHQEKSDTKRKNGNVTIVDNKNSKVGNQMKKLFALLLFFPSAAFADIKQEFVTSAQITVDMPYVVTNKVGTTYSLSGNNITPSVTVGDTTTSGKIGGINVGSLTDGVPAMIQTDTSVTSAGSAFSKTESVIMGDATPSTVTPSSGIAALPVLGGQTTIGSGGTAGSLALTSLSSGVHTCTAGGSGTSCIGSTKVTITID